MALTAPRSTPRRADSNQNTSITVPAAASQTFYLGALVCAGTTGYLVNGSATTGLTALGVFGGQPFGVPAASYTSSGTTGSDSYEVQTGTFLMLNSASDAVTQAEIGKVVYIEDNLTVCKGATGHSAAGVAVELEPSAGTNGAGVWVTIGATAII